jgi:hypothetical protein
MVEMLAAIARTYLRLEIGAGARSPSPGRATLYGRRPVFAQLTDGLPLLGARL